jgi:hypothetical protein
MLRRSAIIALFTASLLASSFGSVPAHPLLPQTSVVIDGIGVDNIRVGESTKSDVIAAYGAKFKLIEHARYSCEMVYNSGLSFYYCYKDPQEKIFLVKVQATSKVTTGKGVLVGEDTLEDVLNIYGKVELSSPVYSGTVVAQYGGLKFFVETNAPEIMRTEEPDEVINNNAEKFLPLKISYIEIMSPLLVCNFCNEYDEKQ